MKSTFLCQLAAFASLGLGAIAVPSPNYATAHARPASELGRIVKDYGHVDADVDVGYDNGAEQVVMNPFDDDDSYKSKGILDHPPGAPGKDQGHDTIYEIIEACDGFSYLRKAIKFSKGITKKLNDTEARLTFFAPPDSAIRPPKRRVDPHGFDLLAYESIGLADVVSDFSLADLSTMIDDLEAEEKHDHDHKHDHKHDHHHHKDDKDKDSDKDKKRRRKILRAIVTAVLEYHILPKEHTVQELGMKTTHATELNLHSGLLDGEPVRIKVEPAGLFTPATVNVGSRVTGKDYKAKNGYVHVVSRPLLPPPAVFQELFLIPAAFSTFTSAIQRVRLADALDIRYDSEKHKLKGTNVTTVFVPSNRAFNKLPTRLKLFLFSPFGERVLKKLLEFHVVPGFVFHSDYTYNATSKITTYHHTHPTFSLLSPPSHAPTYNANLTTLLPGKNGTLPVSVTQYSTTLPQPIPGRDPIPYTVTLMTVNGVSVGSKLRDIPALNGAVHVVGEVLNPMKGKGHHHHHGGHHDHPGMLGGLVESVLRGDGLDADLYEDAFDEDCDEWEYVFDEEDPEDDVRDAFGDEDEDEERESGWEGWEGWEDWLVKWADEQE